MQRYSIGKKIFNKKDQNIFLNLSKDYNQAHLINKKKLDQFNTKKTIVHGMHILLYAFELFLKKTDVKIASIDCNFIKPIFLNQKINFYLYKNNFKEKKSDFYLEIENTSKKICVIIIFSEKKNFFLDKSKNKRILIDLKKLKNNQNNFLKFKFKAKLKDKKDFNIFPSIVKNHSVFFCESLVRASYFIGMKFPGKNSIFYNINFNLNKLNFKKKYLLFMIKQLKSKIKIFSILVDGFLKMNIKCLKK